MKRALGSHLTVNTWLIVIFTIGFGFFFCGMPKISDDYSFMAHLKPWFDRQGILLPENGGNIFEAGVPWNELWEGYCYRYNTDNIRLTNIAALILLMFPKWVGSGLVTIMLAWSIILMFKIAKVNWERSGLMAPVLFLATFTLPWINQFGNLDFQMNYVFPGWLLLLFYHHLQRDIDDGLKGKGRHMFLTLFLSLLVGISHEGFSIPLIAGLVVLSICFRRWRTAESYTAIGIIAIGTLVLMSCPGMQTRYQVQVSHSGFLSLWHVLELTVKCYTSFLLMLIVLFHCLWKRELRNKVISDTVVCFLTISLTAFLVHLGSHADLRMSYIGEISSIIILIILLHTCPRPAFWRNRTIKNYIIAALLAPTLLFLAANAWLSFRIRQLLPPVIEEYVRNPGNTLYSDSPIPGKLGIICDYYYFIELLNYLHHYYNPEAGVRCIVPSILEYANDTAGMPIGDGFFKVGRYFFVSESSMPEGFGNFVPLEADYGNGYEPFWGFVTPFRSKADDKIYFWIMTCENFHALKSPKIKKIRFNADYEDIDD